MKRLLVVVLAVVVMSISQTADAKLVLGVSVNEGMGVYDLGGTGQKSIQYYPVPEVQIGLLLFKHLELLLGISYQYGFAPYNDSNYSKQWNELNGIVLIVPSLKIDFGKKGGGFYLQGGPVLGATLYSVAQSVAADVTRSSQKAFSPGFDVGLGYGWVLLDFLKLTLGLEYMMGWTEFTTPSGSNWSAFGHLGMMLGIDLLL